MQRGIMLCLGVALIAGGIVGARLTWTGGVDAQAWEGSGPTTTGASEDEMTDPQTRQTHSAMHALMSGAEEMMGVCTGGIGHMMSGMSMDGMREGAE